MASSLPALLLLVQLAAAMAVSASASQDSVGPVFFVQKDLQLGSKMTLHFTRATAGLVTLPRGRADAIPFASAKLPEILSRLSVPTSSPTVADMRSTLAECEAAPLAGEAKRCATSIESMADFAASSLGTRDIRAVSTKLSVEGATPKQAYTVQAVSPLPVTGGNMVACHGMRYAYAVFGCHTTTAAAYTVTLAGQDGTTAEALAACHADASPGVAEAYKKRAWERAGVPLPATG